MMRERGQEERPGGHPGRSILREDEPDASMSAAFDAAAGTHEPGRRGYQSAGRALDALHATAGNGAIARLLAGTAGGSRRTGEAQTHAAHATLPAPPTATATTRTSATATVQRATGDEPAPQQDVAPGGDSSGSDLGTGGAPTPGASWTHIGPPSNTTYDVSGSLRDVSNTISARTEAGSETATPTSDTDTWTPPGGTEKITAARVTVDQVVELPNWTDKSKATTNQQAEWDRFKTAITTHEAGHVSTDKTSFASAHTAMVGQAPADGDKKLDAVAAQAKTDNDTYDTTTKHGLTQGTGINPNIDEVTKVP
jgi:hypothetical protein